MAHQGHQDTEWLRESERRAFGRHADIRKALKNGKMVTEIVQAINRVHCRKVIDGDGNCPETQAYILLPQSELADEIINGIQLEMPGIRILEDWDYAPQKTATKASGYELAMIGHYENMNPGSVLFSDIRNALGASSKTMDRLAKAMQEPGTELAAAAEAFGITYETRREGRTRKAYLVKVG